jgi:hypothetical protein
MCKKIVNIPWDLSIFFEVMVWHLWKDKNMLIFSHRSYMRDKLGISVNNHVNDILTELQAPKVSGESIMHIKCIIESIL